MLKNLFIALIIINLFACTSSQFKKDIVDNNWQAIGEYHGKNGTPEYALSKLQGLSTKYGNGEVDYQRYQLGYEEAVTIYCQPEKAFPLGGAGKPYYGVCDRFPHGVKFRQDWRLADQFLRRY